MAREGCREGEALAFQVKDFDLRLGVVDLKENKTDDPRSWALDPGVTLALRAWVKLRGAGPDDYMFVDDAGSVLTSDHRLAELLRESLWKAEVRRPELHNDSANSRKLRAHDLRATFTTLALAVDRSETWVKDRTGWTTSVMLEKYRRAARSATELGLGWLTQLDQAIPELSAVAAPGADCPGIAPEVVGHRGLEPRANGLRRRGDGAENTDLAETKPGREAEREQLEASPGQSGAVSALEPDAVEQALAAALVGATAAGQWEVVARLAAELEARRKARSGTVDLAIERAKRGRKP